MSAAAGVVLAVAVVATHTGSCLFPTAVPVEVPEVRGELEEAGVVAASETQGDAILITFDDGRTVRVPASRRYLIGNQPQPGQLLLLSTATDGDALVAAIPFDEVEQCYVAYSPANVDRRGLILDSGLLVPLGPGATDEEVLLAATGGQAETRPLVAGAVFYTHDGACIDDSGRVSRIVRGVYERGLPPAP